MLNKPSVPLDRLLKICRVAGIQAAELFARAEKREPRHTSFTAEQDELFFERPEFSTYFMRLMIDGQSPDQIAAEEGLSQLSTDRYLSGLEKVGLLERVGHNRIRLRVSPPIGFAPDSKVLRAMQAEFLREVTETVLSPRATDAYAILKPLRLNRKLYAELVEELRSVVDRFSYLSESPRSHLGMEDGGSFKLALAVAPSGAEPEPGPVIPLDQ